MAWQPAHVGIFLVHGQSVARGLVHCILGVLDELEVDVRRRLRNLLAQEQLAHRLAANGRRAAAFVSRIEHQEARERQNARAWIVRGERVRRPARNRLFIDRGL